MNVTLGSVANTVLVVPCNISNVTADFPLIGKNEVYPLYGSAIVKGCVVP